MLTGLFDLINSIYFPIVTSAILLLLALIMWIHYRRLILPLKLQSELILKELEQISAHHSNEQFFQQVEEVVSQQSLFSHHWYLYRHRITISDKPLNFEPDLIFNLSSLLSSQVNLRFYQSLPGMFIQMGLLLTFIGLLVALYAAGQGLLSTDLGTVRESLQTLLMAATFKFSTSLAGILAALLFAWREKHHWHVMQQKLNLFNQYLESYLYSYLPSEFFNKTNSFKSTEGIKSSKANHTDEQLQKIAQLASESLENTIEAQSVTLEKMTQNASYFASKDERHLSSDQHHNNLIVALNMGFSTVKKEIQRLNSSLGVTTRRLYGAIHHVGQINEDLGDKKINQKAYRASQKANSNYNESESSLKSTDIKSDKAQPVEIQRQSSPDKSSNEFLNKLIKDDTHQHDN